MKSHLIVLMLLSALLITSLAPSFSSSTLEDQSISPPPTPHFILTTPKINEITYKVDVRNTGNLPSSIRIDIALPKTWSPDTYVEIKEIKLALGTPKNYFSRENNYTYVILNLEPGESTQMNITFYSLKYRVGYYTHNYVQNISYPNEYAIYTEPERYIESNDIRIESLATALVGDRKNPFRIAEKIYDFVISALRYETQPEIRGALWALLNRKGDCSEYGTLFVALMRAVGIPARIVTGHVSNVLSRGGIANATNLWLDSPHLWAEFYVDGYGWIPVDPTLGEGDSLDHFSILWPTYLPFLKGPIMEAPCRSLLTLKAEHLEPIDYTAVLLVTPLAFLPFENKAIPSIYEANELTNSMRRAADDAYDFGFNITESYKSLLETYDSLYNATRMISKGDSFSADIYAKDTLQNARQTLQLVSTLSMNQARKAITKTWNELRLLGALSGENYIRRSEEYESTGDYANMVKYAYYARTTADRAPSIFTFIGPVLLCVFTIWIINGKMSSQSAHT